MRFCLSKSFWLTMLVTLCCAGMASATPRSTLRAPQHSSVLAPAVRQVAAQAMKPDQPWPGNPFAPTSFWNTALGANAPIDGQSAAYVSELSRQVNLYGPWINTYQYSVPVYLVGAGALTQYVKLDAWGPDLQTAFANVPVPVGATAARGSDQEMTIWQPSTNRMWEFWKMHLAADGWHARWGGEMDSVSTSPGYFTHVGVTSNWGASATGLPLLGGLITFADLARGYINHAVAISLPETAPHEWSWPAQRSDGSTKTPGIVAIPEGTRFRLDPSLDLSTMTMPPLDRMLAQAAQRYGIVVRDQAGAVTFSGQDPTGLAVNPWTAVFGRYYPSQILSAFPWAHLEALKTQLTGAPTRGAIPQTSRHG